MDGVTVIDLTISLLNCTRLSLVTTYQNTTMSADKKVSKIYYFFYVCRLENESDDELESIRQSESVLSAFEYVHIH